MSVEPKAVPAASAPITPRAGRTGAGLPNRQAVNAYKDYREVPPHVFLDETYNASGGFSGRIGSGRYSYLIPNATENFYQTRNRMSIYLNDFRQYINAKYEPIFREVIKTYVQTDQGADMSKHLYLDFVDNVTGGGASKNDFLKTVIRQAYIHDVGFIVMDRASDSVQPYLYLKAVKDIAGYTVDIYGGLTSITFEDGEEKKGDKAIYRRRYIGLDRWAILISEDRKNWTVSIESPNTLGILPVYPLWTHRGDDLADYSTFEPSNYGIAGYCAWLYDKGSKLDYVIDKQAHATLVLQGDIAAVPNGADNALIISPSDHSVFQPTYISPDPALPRVHQERINAVEDKIIKMMAEGGVSVSFNGAAESGVARGYKFWATNSTLKQTVVLLTSADKWIFETYKRFTSDTSGWVAYSEYPADFTPTTSLAMNELVELINFYEEKGMMKNAADAHMRLRALIDPMASREDSQDLLDEIEDRYDGTAGGGGVDEDDDE